MSIPFKKIPTGNDDLDRVQQNIVTALAAVPDAQKPNVVTVSADYKVTGLEDVLHVNSQQGPVKVTLLSPSVSNRPITIKQINLQTGSSKVNQVTIATADGSKTIAGASTLTLDATGTGSVSITADNTQHWPSTSAGGNPPIPVPSPTPGPPGGGVQSVLGLAPIASSGGTNPIISLLPSGVAPGIYTNPQITIDAHGLIDTAISLPGFDVRADGIQVGTIELIFLDASNLSDGARCWVDSVGDYFRLALSTLAPTATTIVNAFNKPGYQWLRLFVVNLSNSTPTDWYIDPSAGNDENTGLVGFPLKTCAEWYYRTHEIDIPIGAGLFVHLLSDIPDTDYITAWTNGGDFVQFQGTVAVTDTLTVTSAQLKSAALNHANEITVTGFDFTSFVGTLLRVQGTTQYAAITKAISLGVARLGELWDGPTFRPIAGGVTSGATIELITQTKGPLLATNNGGTPFRFSDIRFDGSGPVEIIETRFGPSAFTRRCIFGGTGYSRVALTSGNYVSCIFRSEFQDNGVMNDGYTGCAWLAPLPANNNFGGTRQVSLGSCVAQGAGLLFTGVQLVIRGDFGTFDLVNTGPRPAGFQNDDDLGPSTITFSDLVAGRHYGSGNAASTYMWMVNNCVVYYQSSAPPTMDSNQSLVNGATVTTSSLPMAINPFSGSGIVDNTNSAGLLAITSAGLVTPRTIVPGDASVLVSNGDGTAGNPSITGNYQPGTGISITGNVIAATGGSGTVTTVTGSTPIVITGTPTTTPNVTIQGALVSGSTSTTAQNLGALTSGLLKGTVSGGINTIATAISGTDYQPAGNYITALTGDGTATGPGSATFTLATTGVTPGSYTYGGFTVDADGRLTAASSGTTPITAITGTPPIFITGGNNVTIQGSIVSGSTSTTAQNIGALSSGVLQAAISAGVATLSTFVSGAARIPFGSGTNGQFTDDASLTASTTGGLGGAGTAVTILNTSGATTPGFFTINTSTNGAAGAVSRWSTTAGAGSNYVQMGMLGNSFTPTGLLGPNVALIELFAGSANLLLGNVGTGDVIFETTSSRTERMRIANGGNVSIASLTAGGLVKAAATTGVLSIASAGTDFVTSVSVTAPITNTGTSANPNIGHATSGITPGTYVTPQITVNATGHITSASFVNTYQQIESDGTPVTSEATLNFIAPLHAADSGGSPFRTNATLLYDNATITLNGSNQIAVTALKETSGPTLLAISGIPNAAPNVNVLVRDGLGLNQIQGIPANQLLVGEQLRYFMSIASWPTNQGWIATSDFANFYHAIVIEYPVQHAATTVTLVANLIANGLTTSGVTAGITQNGSAVIGAVFNMSTTTTPGRYTSGPITLSSSAATDTFGVSWSNSATGSVKCSFTVFIN